MAEQGRVRQTGPQSHKPVDEEIFDSSKRGDDPVEEPEKPSDPVKVMQQVFTAMKKHFDAARAEAQKLPNSDELAAMLANLNMAEVAMDTMVAHAEGSLV